MAIEFYLAGTIKDSNKVVLGHRGGNGKPNSVSQIIEVDKADEYISKRKSVDKKEAVLGWGLNLSTLTVAALVAAGKPKFGGVIGKAFAATVIVLEGLALSLKLSTKYRHSQIAKLNEKFDVQETDSLELNFNPDYEPLKKPEPSKVPFS